MSTYSKLWKLEVNVEKTKIVVFSRNGRYSKNIRFVYEEEKLEIVKEFKYLGVILKIMEDSLVLLNISKHKEIRR